MLLPEFATSNKAAQAQRAQSNCGTADNLINSGMEGKDGSNCATRPLFKRVRSSPYYSRGTRVLALRVAAAAAALALSRFGFAPDAVPTPCATDFVLFRRRAASCEILVFICRRHISK
jgi:hypothetical protein